MRNETKAVIASLVVIAFALTAVSGVTYSWWSDSEDMNVTISTGYLGVDVVEGSVSVDDIPMTFDVSSSSAGGISSASISIPVSNVSPFGTTSIKYKAHFESTVDAKYLITAASDESWIDVSVTIDGLTSNNWTQMDSSEKIVDVIVTLSYDGDTPMSTEGSVTIVNEITQLGRPDVEVDPETGVMNITVANESELRGFGSSMNSGTYSGKDVNVKIVNNIDLSDGLWTPINLWSTVKSVTIEGNDKTISNMVVNGEKSVGFIGSTAVPLTIKNLKFSNPVVETTGSYAGTIAGYQYNAIVLMNVDVSGGKIISTAEKGISLGGLIGYSVQNDGATATLSNCEVIGMEIQGYHSIGGLVGVTKKADCSDSLSISNCRSASTLVYSATGGIGAHDYVSGDNGYADATFKDTGNTKNNTIYNVRDISNMDELFAFANDVNAGNNHFRTYVRLMSDINLENQNWTPIGTWTSINSDPEFPFSGVFVGNGHTISNIAIDSPNESCVGFFGWVEGGRIADIVIENVRIDAYSSIGAIAGGFTGSITGCTVKGNIEIIGHYNVGGIVGNSYMTVTDCKVIGNDGSRIEATYDTIDYEGDSVGGAIGYSREGSHVDGIEVSNIDISGSRKVGGIIGSLGGDATVTNCSYSSGTVGINAPDDYVGSHPTNLYVGGLIGELTSLTNLNIRSNTVSDASISAAIVASAGEIVGGSRGGSFTLDSSNTSSNTTVVEKSSIS